MSYCLELWSTFSVFPTQFLCLKNIRTFLVACSDVFGMRKSELFESFDLFDVRDFGKVRWGRPVTQGQFPPCCVYTESVKRALMCFDIHLWSLMSVCWRKQQRSKVTEFKSHWSDSTWVLCTRVYILLRSGTYQALEHKLSWQLLLLTV